LVFALLGCHSDPDDAGGLLRVIDGMQGTRSAGLKELRTLLAICWFLHVAPLTPSPTPQDGGLHCPGFCARPTFAGMEHTVWWYSDESSYVVFVRHGARIVTRFRAEAMAESPAEMREHARDKAIELALKFKIELRNVVETPHAVD